MKQIELNLQKRLLIVEGDRIEQLSAIGTIYAEYGKIICKGSELTEDVAKGFVGNMIENSEIYFLYRNYKPHDKSFLDTALESFKSAIEAQGYYWGENPVSLDREKVYRDMGDEFKADGILRAWRQAELKMFHPEKTLIFKIV